MSGNDLKKEIISKEEVKLIEAKLIAYDQFLKTKKLDEEFEYYWYENYIKKLK